MECDDRPLMPAVAISGKPASAPAQKVVGAVVTAIVAVLVLYPVVYLFQAAVDTGDPNVRPPQAYGLDNFALLPNYSEIMLNTLGVSFAAALMALVFGFVIAWILTRTNVPMRGTLEQLMVVPYYVTPLLGALAWSLLGAPESGFINQVWRALGAKEALFDITGPLGIAWVMALFEGSVAFVMIAAVMKSMDPSLEEASQVIGAGRFRTMMRVTLPLVAPGVLGAAVYVFAEMLGSFSAALVLGSPNRFYVITTAIYQLVSQYPPRLPLAAAMGVSLFVVMFAMIFLYRRLTRGRSYVTVSGKSFRPRVMDVGTFRWVLFAVCAVYLIMSVFLPMATLAFASLQRLATAFPHLSDFTLEHYRTAFSLNAVRSALGNSLLLGFLTATIGVVLTGLVAWIIQRSRLPGRDVLEYIVMFPQAVPRLVFAFGMMWAWLVFPIPIYGTLWLLLIAYLTVFLPLGVRTISGVLVQLDKSLEECGEVCGASWGYRLRTITMPLLRPGLIAAWLLIFVASVRELGASILLMGPNSKVLTPAIVEAFFSSSSELTAAMALIQTVVVGLVMLVFLTVSRRAARQGA
jgi:iron(III) transport system permease protein